MANKLLSAALLLSFAFAGCSKGSKSTVTPTSPSTPSTTATPGNPGSGPGIKNQPGVITAGEWNDLDNWSFWEKIISNVAHKTRPEYWSFYNTNRISLQVTGTDAKPIIDAEVELKRDGTTIFTAHTDNKGEAVLWPNLSQQDENIDFSKLKISINSGAFVLDTVKPFKDGINNITLPPATANNKIEIAFVVDATGSMGDEMQYLKTELLDVIAKVKEKNPNASLLTSSVFYRDQGDDYVTKVSDFTSDIGVTLDFIRAQKAGGGGDFPEALHSAMDKAINGLQWSTTARTRLVFLVLDAPPHHETAIITNLRGSVSMAAEKGIKLIPITASGIDKETEFLMRFMAMTTNGTYVFITDDSGVGNDHLEATVGQYQVEQMNALMIRLINKYAE